MANYPIPAWLEPQAPSGNGYAQGFAIGAKIQQDNAQIQHEAQAVSARLAQQTYVAQLEANTAQEIAQRRADMDQQRIEMTKQHQIAMEGLAQQKINMTAKNLMARNKMAGAKFAAQQQYQQRVAAGEDPTRVMMELGPAMGQSAGGMGTMSKALAPRPTAPPAVVEEYDGQKFLKVTQPGGNVRMQQIQQGSPEDASVVTINGRQYLKVPHASGFPSYQQQNPIKAEEKLSDAAKSRLMILRQKIRLIEEKYKNPILNAAMQKSPAFKAAYEADSKQLAELTEEMNRIAPPVTNQLATVASSIQPEPGTNASTKKRVKWDEFLKSSSTNSP